MTTGVAVMNKSGIALAADTLMSFSGSGVEGSRARHQKIFALSDEQPVAIMVYNRTRYMGRELIGSIIPRFKTEHGRERFRHVDDWALCFQDFLKGYVRPDEEEVGRNLAGFVELIASEVVQTAEVLRRRFGAKAGAVPQPIAIRDLQAAVELVEIDMRDAATVLPPADVSAIKRRLSANPTHQAAKLMMSDSALWASFERLLQRCLAVDVPSGHHCGIVIAGYGAEQDEPALVDMILEGHVGPFAKTFRRTVRDMAARDVGCVEAFAQRDMVDAFLVGMERDLREEVEDLHLIGVRKALDALVAASEIAITADAILDIVAAASEEFDAALEKNQHERYRRRIIGLVDVMERHDLADFAGALVFSSMMRHSFRIDPPTVGGGVDVAVMSRASKNVELRLRPRAEPNWQAA